MMPAQRPPVTSWASAASPAIQCGRMELTVLVLASWPTAADQPEASMSNSVPIRPRMAISRVRVGFTPTHLSTTGSADTGAVMVAYRIGHGALAMRGYRDTPVPRRDPLSEYERWGRFEVPDYIFGKAP